MNLYYLKLGIFLLLPSTAWPGCHMSSGNVNFGNYDVFDAWPRDAVVSFNITCHEPSTANLVLSAGPSAVSGGMTQRKLIGVEDKLDYNLFIDPAHTQVWGDGSGGSATITLTTMLLNTPQRIAIYGRIPTGQNVTAGTYTDTITVMVTP